MCRRGEGKQGENSSSLKLKKKTTQKNNKENSSPKALGAAVSAMGEAEGNYMEVAQVSLLWVGGIVLCTVVHTGCDDKANVLFLLWIVVKSVVLQFFVMRK